MDEVKITEVNGAKCFDYKGIEVDRETWESAGCPMCCEKITDNDMCEIAKSLYATLCDAFGKHEVGKYVNKIVHGVNFNNFDKIDEYSSAKRDVCYKHRALTFNLSVLTTLRVIET